MVNETGIINKGIESLSFLSQTVTGKIVEFLNSYGYQFSVRWVSLMVLFVSLFLIYIAIKITSPLIKWALIIMGVLLIGGTIIPW